MAMLHRRCCVSRTSVFRVPVLKALTGHVTGTRLGSATYARAARFDLSVCTACSGSQFPLRNLHRPFRPHLAVSGHRTSSIRAQKKAEDAGSAVESINKPTSGEPAAADEPKPVKSRVRKKKADAATIAARAGSNSSQQGVQIDEKPLAASPPSTEEVLKVTALNEPAAASEPKPLKTRGRRRTAALAPAAENIEDAPGQQQRHSDVTANAASTSGTEEALRESTVEEATASDETKPVKGRERKKKAATAPAPEPEKYLPIEQNGQPSLDLHANVPPGNHWQDVKSWVVFSDLHVGFKTADVACQILRRVRLEAAARDAGILFLGRPTAVTCWECLV